MKLEPITNTNSTVDGRRVGRAYFYGLGFASKDLHADKSYPSGCLKYLPHWLDYDPTIGHMVRSTFSNAKRVLHKGTWMWAVDTPEPYAMRRPARRL